MADVLLGTDTQTGERVYLTTEGRQLSTYIIGTIGSGKSTLLEQIAIQDMKNGDGLCFLDPHDESAERILEHVPHERMDDVIVWDPEDREYPFGLTPFVCNDIEEVDRKAQDFIETLGSLKEFSEIFETAPRMKNILQNTALAFILNQGMTLAETPKFLDNEGYRRKFYPAAPQGYEQVPEFWKSHDRKPDREQEQIISSSLNKVQRFQNDRTMRSIFGQPTSSIDFRRAMDEGKIVLVKLNSQWLGADNAAFVGAFIVYEIYRAARSRADTPEHERRQFHLIADEFQTYMTTVFPDLIEQVRKFNVDVTIAHQRRDQLPRNGRNAPLVAGNKVVFTVTGHDAQELVKEFRIVQPEPEPAGQQAIRSITPDALSHLRVHGHMDGQVVREHRTLLQKIDEHYRYLANTLSLIEARISQSEKDYPALSRMFPPDASDTVTSASYRELEQSKQRAMRKIDEFLYLVMTGSDDEFSKEFTTDQTVLEFTHSPKTPFHSGIDPHPWPPTYPLEPIPENGWTALINLVCDLKTELMEITFSVYDSFVHPAEIIRRNIMWMLTFENTRDLWEANTYVLHTIYLENGGTPEKAQENYRYLMKDRLQPKWGNLPDNAGPDYFDSCSRHESSEGTPEMWELAYLNIMQVRAILICTFKLAYSLRSNPLQVHTGQYEPVTEKPRLYSDVEAEMANTLASLPRFTARCKLIQQGEPREYVIETHNRPGPEPHAQTQANQIKNDSRSVYGRSRSDVENEIARRLRDGPQQQPETSTAPKPEKVEQPTDFWEKE